MKTKDELIEYLDIKLTTETSDAKVSIPNDIFRKLSKIKGVKNASQFSFCFNYLVLNSFLTKYGAYWDYDTELLFTKKDMKVILGYNRENKTINHLIKVGGILENEKFITHENDIPCFHGVKKYSIVTPSGEAKEMKSWELSYVSDMPQHMQDRFSELKRGGNVRFNAPIPNFLNGNKSEHSTLNNRYSTFTITYKLYRELLTDTDLTLLDISVFYFFRQIGYSGEEFEISLEKISSQVGISRRSLSVSINKLCDKKLLNKIDTGYSYDEIVKDDGTVSNLFTRNARKYRVLRYA